MSFAEVQNKTTITGFSVVNEVRIFGKQDFAVRQNRGGNDGGIPPGEAVSVLHVPCCREQVGTGRDGLPMPQRKHVGLGGSHRDGKFFGCVATA
jgi:hypothetical protein